MKRSVCAVPFSISDVPIVKNFEFFMNDYFIDSVVAPRGIGVDGKDIGYVENRGPTGFIATSDLEASIQRCDEVLIFYKKKESPLYSYAIQALEMAIQQKKNIFCLLQLEDAEKEKYKKTVLLQETKIWFVEQDILSSPSLKELAAPLYKPFAPIVFVGELAEKSQGYEVFCNLLNAFTRIGVNVSGISAEPATALFRHHFIDLSQVNSTPAYHVYCINKYIKELEKQENPSLILINLPMPMIKFDEDIHYDFGVSAYMISQAIEPAYFIACSPFGFFSSDFWSGLSQNFESKFGYPINIVHMSNKAIDSSNSDKGQVCFIHMPTENTDAIIREQSDNTGPVQIMNLSNLLMSENVAKDVQNSILDLPYGLIGGDTRW